MVFILSDDHRYDAMSFMGHQFAKTPVMDSMAANGVHLKNAFVTTSLCSPSRASIPTGLYPFRQRVIDNNRAIPPGTLYFPQYLQKAGYATAFMGKWPMGGESDDPQPGFDRWVSFRGQSSGLKSAQHSAPFPMQTRRRFLKAGWTAVAAGALAPSIRSVRTAEVSRRKPGFELSVASYTFREFDLARTLAMTRRVGISRICLKSFHLPLDSSADACAAAVKLARDSGVAVWGGGVITLKTVGQVEQAFGYAKAAGMSCIVGVPHPEVLDLVERKIKESNIRVAIHNHGPGDALYPLPQDALARIRERDERLGVCVDVGHTTRIGGDPAQAIRECGPRVLDIHLKDVTGAESGAHEVEIGRGMIDIPGIVGALRAVDYQGFLSFEYEKDPDDPLCGLAESVGYVRGVLAATG